MISDLVKKQQLFFDTNETKSLDFRIKNLKLLKTILEENEQLLYEAIYQDFKKSEFDTYTSELSLIYHDIDISIKQLKKWAKPKRYKTNLINLPAKSYVIPEPIGVSLVIGAWNYPYQLSLAPLIASMSAGNTVTLKPSELPSHTSKAMSKLINENFSSDYLTVVEGGIPETTELLNQKFGKIFFTGSLPVGKIVYQAAAKNLTPVTLELGGKSPSIVMADCNLPVTVKRLVWAKFLNSGQTCIAPDYILLEESIKEEFLKLAKAEIEKQQYSFENNNYVQIINDKNLDRLIGLIDNNKVYHGGSFDQSKRYMEPTIMHNVTWNDKIMKDEIFGPILPILTFTHLEEAIKTVKSKPKPLSAYVFTSSNTTKQKTLNELSFGGGAINDAVMHITNSNMPFGGVGQSGIGAYHGENGFRAFSHYKSILDKPTWLETSLKYHPYTESKLKWFKWLMRLG